MTIMSSKMMSSEESPTTHISCSEVISTKMIDIPTLNEADTMSKNSLANNTTYASAIIENHHDDYTNATTLKAPQRRSYSNSEDDTATPDVRFIDPSVVTAAPLPIRAGATEDDIQIDGAITPNDASTQTEVELATMTPDDEVPTPPAAAQETAEEPCAKFEESCGITCLYFALQCCDCVIM